VPCVRSTEWYTPMNGIDSGTGGITRSRYAPRNTISIRPNGTSIWLRTSAKRSGVRRRIHAARASIGTQATAIEARKIAVPTAPKSIGTMVAQKDRPHRLSRANLNDRPSRWNGPNSFASRSATITSMNENETRSDELLKKKSVYKLSRVPRQKLRSTIR